jgi:hypothetical protein
LKDPSVDGMIIFKWIFKKCDEAWTALFLQGNVAGFCERVNEYLGVNQM